MFHGSRSSCRASTSTIGTQSFSSHTTNMETAREWAFLIGVVFICFLILVWVVSRCRRMYLSSWERRQRQQINTEFADMCRDEHAAQRNPPAYNSIQGAPPCYCQVVAMSQINEQQS
ncbi:hypothetical protein QR680_000518 [Steinernema hermaphroditum]|uniref:Uncharacterized protein n=1 Tax=Steinernema hermaphroditum TaxID=289476 RepID=A0AA39GUV4_9BILA|nr:hypothetical protein QR680_000518 [Steinernema hermaphroditum]